LFLNTNHQPITRFGIRYIVKKYGTIAIEKIPNSTATKLGPHKIRHSTAMHLIRAGNDMVSLWLGHADINTTHIYVEIDLEMKRKILGCSPTSIAAEDKAPKPQWKQDKVLKWLDSLLQPRKLCEASG
jgi:site-specific recombinase XerD